MFEHHPDVLALNLGSDFFTERLSLFTSESEL